MPSTNDRQERQYRSCERHFDTRGKRDAHHGKEHQKVVANVNGVTESNGTSRNEGEKFSCQCGREFLHPWSRQHHSKKCTASMLMVSTDGDNSQQDDGTLTWHVD
jgi:predicted SprT family Zn-dependent metalloprotease